MADNEKVVINLSTGLEDPERVMIAFLVGGAALDAGKRVAYFLTKEAVRLGLPGHALGTACDGCPPIERLFEQVAEKGGELCWSARSASTRAASKAPSSSRTPALPARRRSGSGSAPTTRPSSATERHPARFDRGAVRVYDID